MNPDDTRRLSVFLLELVRQTFEHDATLDEVVKLHASFVVSVEHLNAEVREIHRSETRTAGHHIELSEYRRGENEGIGLVSV